MRAASVTQTIHLCDTPISLDTDTVRVALLQLNDASGGAKVPVLRPDGSTRLAWVESEPNKNRISKALALLHWIKDNEPSVRIVVLPEYSVPLDSGITSLQKACTDLNLIIIAGGDTVDDPETGKVLNRAPILVPGCDPIWITKRSPAKEEATYLDVPEETELHRLVWSHGGKPYWVLVYSCLDYLVDSIPDVLQLDLAGPGLFIVPMCSPRLNDFLVFSEVLLRRPNGTASLFCNAVGSFGSGRSCINAVQPGKRAAEPTHRLPGNSEGILIADIDLSQLAPPKVSQTATRAAILRPRALGFRFDGKDLRTSAVPSYANPDLAERAVRGILNPQLFAASGKKMRIAFLEVSKYASVREKVQGQAFETLAVMGQCDLIVTHLHQFRSALFFEIIDRSELPVKLSRRHKRKPIGGGRPEEEPEFPFFEVERFLKVLGFPVFSRSTALRQVPNTKELESIVALARDWNNDAIDETTRAKCLERAWILKTTSTIPGAINAIVTIALDDRGSRLADRLRDFEERVVLGFVQNEEVTSIYAGTGHSLNVDFVLRVTSDVDKLFSFIESIHEAARDNRESVVSTSYVVVNRLSDLSLDKTLQIEELAAGDARYAHQFFLPNISPEDSLRFSSLPLPDKETVLGIFSELEQAARNIAQFPENARKSGGWDIQRLRTSLAAGILNFFYPTNERERRDALVPLKETHDFFQIEVEQRLTKLIRGIPDDVFEEFKAASNILSQKKKSNINYTDKVKLTISLAKEGGVATEMLEDLQPLYHTTRGRNVFAHADTDALEDFGAERIKETLLIYFRFLEKWW